MTEAILTLNVGSSSIKFALYEAQADTATPTPLIDGEIRSIGTAPQLTVRETANDVPEPQNLPTTWNHEQLVQRILDWIDEHTAGLSLVGVGHRVVHGGTDFTAPVLIDEGVMERLEKLVPLAPHHQPHNLSAVRAVAAFVPDVAQVACFDTAFHRTNPSLATSFALPRALRDEGVRRYGFHGLSYEYIAGVLPRHTAAAKGRVIVAHLGHGASMCAMREGRSLATTMGFSALDGLPMGRRCGTLDPGVILYLIKEKGMDYEALTDLLYRRCGLLGVSGLSDDMHVLLDSRTAEAKEAVDLFVYRIGRELGSLAAALGDIDVLVFTGGIGEHASIIREGVCRNADWLGIRLDFAANARGLERINEPESPVEVFVIPTDEELMIAKHTLRVTGRG